jgi:hypothetical protein
VLLPDTARDRAVLVFRFAGGAEVFRVVEPGAFFFEGVFWVVLKPRLPGRLVGEGVEAS